MHRSFKQQQQQHTHTRSRAHTHNCYIGVTHHQKFKFKTPTLFLKDNETIMTVHHLLQTFRLWFKTWQVFNKNNNNKYQHVYYCFLSLVGWTALFFEFFIPEDLRRKLPVFLAKWTILSLEKFGFSLSRIESVSDLGEGGVLLDESWSDGHSSVTGLKCMGGLGVVGEGHEEFPDGGDSPLLGGSIRTAVCWVFGLVLIAGRGLFCTNNYRQKNL